MKDLKEKTVRGGLARLCAQATDFSVRLLSLMILARLLGPNDFGLVGMVTALTGVLILFRDFGLSAAAIQSPNVTNEQISTLFWINIAVGILLAFLTAAMAPLIATFYHEPRLLGIASALAGSFLLNAAGIQHGALLQRQMHFTTLAIVSIISLVVSTAIAIGGAMAGYGYWALVGMALAQPLVTTLGVWMASGWIPAWPQRGVGIRSMLHFGGVVTVNGLLIYLASNFEKILLGRFWGADALGLYTRAYQLSNIPTANLNSAVGEVAFSALSRLQHDPVRLKSYFLKGYSLLLAMTVPTTVACTVFADDVILVFLGPKWRAAGIIFRLLAPTILVFAMANPLSWLVTSLGMVRRSLKMGLVIAPIMIVSYVIGLPYGPKGVAFAYSAVMILWIIPVIAWSVHGTAISVRDVLIIAVRPLASSIVAAALAFTVRLLYGQSLSPLPRLALENGILFTTFAVMLLFATGQKAFYMDLLRSVTSRTAGEEPAGFGLVCSGETRRRGFRVAMISRERFLRSFVGGRFLRVNEWIWYRLPVFVIKSRAICLYGSFLHSLVKVRSTRTQFHGTFFFRNRPELQMILALVKERPKGSTLRISVLACSNGAEVYSIMWTVRSARPDLNVILHAVDISKEILEIARAGRYSSEANDLVNSPIFDRITEEELQGMFDPENGKLRIKPWLKKGIKWEVGDAADPKLLEVLGEQDIVVANKFLCHMEPENAEKCLRILARQVKSGGYLFVSGVDLEVRTRVALDLGWNSVRDLIQEMHDGDLSVRRDWPWRYWGLEPFDGKRKDWGVRYASVFQIGQPEPSVTSELSCCSSMREAL